MFAMGVVLFRLLSGERPFPTTDEHRLKQNTIECRYNVSSEAWQDVSPAAKDLIRKLIINREERYTAEQAFGHTWFHEAGRSILPRDLTRTGSILEGDAVGGGLHSRAIARVSSSVYSVGGWQSSSTLLIVSIFFSHVDREARIALKIAFTSTKSYKWQLCRLSPREFTLHVRLTL